MTESGRQSAASRAVVSALADWWRAMPPGGVRRSWLERKVDPPMEAGERYYWATSPFRVHRLPIDATEADVDGGRWKPGPELPTTLGLLQATDRRLRLLAARGRVLREWRYDTLDHVIVGPGNSGVRLLARGNPDDYEAAVWSSNRANLFTDRGRDLQISLLKYEAAYIAGTGGDIGGWLNGLTRRLRMRSAAQPSEQP